MTENENALANLAESGIALNSDDLLAGLNTVITEGSAGNDGLPILKMLQANKGGVEDDAEWVSGKNNEQIEEDAFVVVDAASFKHGFVAWKDSKPTERMVPLIGGARVDPSKLPDMGTETIDGVERKVQWKKAMQVEVRVLNGAQAGAVLKYAPSSLGGERCFTQLATDIAAQVGKNPRFIFPVVVLGNEAPYKSKKGSWIRNPVFKVVGWRDQDDNQLGAGGKATVVAEDGAVTDVEVVEEGAQAAEPAAPQRRRRRTTATPPAA